MPRVQGASPGREQRGVMLPQVYRLVTRNTYESEMFDRASKKLGLDKVGRLALSVQLLSVQLLLVCDVCLYTCWQHYHFWWNLCFPGEILGG